MLLLTVAITLAAVILIVDAFAPSISYIHCRCQRHHCHSHGIHHCSVVAAALPAVGTSSALNECSIKDATGADVICCCCQLLLPPALLLLPLPLL